MEERPEDSICVMLDWFSAHLHEEVRKLIVEEKGHSLLYHGGGVTGILQPNDTHVHEPLSKEFKRLEQADVSAQRKLQRGKIPRRTRQKVYDDCHLAWDTIDHDYVGPKSHKQDGWTLPLDGTQDDDIYHDLAPLWHSPALDMDTVRKKLIAEVNRDVDNEVYTDWSQWPELLEEFPPHVAMHEGQEGHRDRCNGDEDGNLSEDEGDDDDDPGGGGAGGDCSGDDAGTDSDEEEGDSEDGDEDDGEDHDGDDPTGAAGSEAGAAEAAASSSGAALAPGLGSGVVGSEPIADVADTEFQAFVPVAV